MDAIKVCLHEEDSKSLLQALKGYHVPSVVENLGDEGIFLVQEVCRKGFTDVLQFLINEGVKLDNLNGTDTPLQTACRHNQASVAKLLLSCGEPVLPAGVHVWQEDSPFYIASRYGYLEVTNILLCHSPALVKHEDTRMSLLYAACLGGNIDIIKRWINPGMDINQPLRNIESFTDCEIKTPLHAACSAGHNHVIDFLVENYPDLKFTEVICSTFPDIIGETVLNFFREIPSTSNTEEDELFLFFKGHLNYRNLHVLHPLWFEPFLPTLVELDISDNYLTELPNCVPWKLQNLRVFKAARNRLKQLQGPAPTDSNDELCPRLEELSLTGNQLESVCPELFQLESLKQLNLSHNQLKMLYRTIHQLGEFQLSRKGFTNRQSHAPKHWQCVNLTKLNVSHNQLNMIPAEISACTRLVTLVANNNKLISFPAPWDCPLYLLNLSNNELERLPPNAELFWRGTLKYLDISHNNLEEIDESVVKLCVLVDLNISHNRIEHLPKPEIWDLSHLCQLNLKHNCLGTGEKMKSKVLTPLRTRSRTSVIEDSTQLHFPMTLSSCLKELRLSHNNLTYVPPSVCDLKSIEILDISYNGIKTLPKELGKLKNCGNLKLKGLQMDKYDTSDCKKTKEILSDLLDQLRGCKPYYKMKMVVIGKKDKGKTTLVNLLAGKKNKGVQNRTGICREEITIKRRKGSVTFPIPFGDKNPDIKFSVWDIEGSEEYTLIHHSVFTQHSLYLLVWDFWSIERELGDIGRWLYNIQATSKAFKAILVGTFLDKMNITPEAKLEEIERLEALIKQKIPYARESLQLCPVSCVNGEGIDKLNNTIYDTAFSMKLPGKNRQCLIGRKYPKSYFAVEQLVMDEQKFRSGKNIPPFLTKSEFNQLLEKLPAKDNDINSVEEEQAVIQFLVETGSLLHYSDQLGALNTLYFLDPAWLCDILVKVFTAPFGKVLLTQGKGKVSRKEVIRLYNEDERFPTFLNDQYIKLLERFEIAVPVNNSQMLFFPSKLPDNPPLDIESTPPKNMKKVCRLYRMAELPSGFWTRLLSRMMTRIEQFSKNEWFYGPVMKQSVRNFSGRKTDGLYKDIHKGKSFRGLQIANAQSSFCREWLKVQYDSGSFCIEPVIFGNSDRDGSLPKGVLITEKSVKEDFAIMGIIVDEIEDIIQDYYPGLLELDETTMEHRLQRFAICPSCYQEQIPPKDLNHFTMEYCARTLMAGNTIFCPRGIKHYLNDLIPDMLLKEIPDKFFLDVSQLQLEETKENFLGGGVTGSVFKGKYGDLDIAVKLYRSDIRNKREDDLFSKPYSTDSIDSGRDTPSSKGSLGAEGIQEDPEEEEEEYVNFTQRGIDFDEAESIKAFRALREMRQEVALTSRLKHPCIISLVGITFSPKLVMALELAPLGSFRSIIDKHQSKRPEINRYQDRDKLNPPLFSKELTFKFLLQSYDSLFENQYWNHCIRKWHTGLDKSGYQIAKGLEYLHCNGIIYKDLKSDNILVMSEDLEASVNLKLSDYGISKYCWSGGTVGLVGTPGYQAPEILDGLAYDEKVDIFSYAMMIYETLTGKRPYQEFENMSQISKAIKSDDKRPSIGDYRIHSQFPYLEDLMEKCWHKDAKERPAATDIVSRHCMQNARFVALASVNTETNRLGGDCVIGAASHDPGNTTVWLWEGQVSDGQLTVLDLETSKPRQTLDYDGPQVTCMARVGSDVWVGNNDDMVYIFGKDKTKGTLTLVDSLQLDGCPVQMESISGQEVRGIKKQSIFIALSNSKVCLYQSESSNAEAHTKKSTRTTKGFKAPKMVTLRSSKLFCMAFTKNSDELWVSGSNFIDIINVKAFKVDRSNTIDLRILINLCDLDVRPKVVQIVRGGDRVWCLLKQSPYILEFCEESYNCLSVLTCDEEILLRRVVRKSLDFDDVAHSEYHTTCPTLKRTGDTSDSDSSVNGDEADHVTPLDHQDDSIYQELYKGMEISQTRRRLSNTRKRLPPHCTSPTYTNLHKTDAPPIPERGKSPPVPMRNTCVPSILEEINNAPPIPARKGNTPPIPERSSNGPPIPERNNNGPPIPERKNDAPPIPKRASSLNPGKDTIVPGRINDPVRFPGIAEKVQIRASTLPNRAQSSGSERSSDSRPTSDPPKLPPKSPLSKQSVYSSESNLNKSSESKLNKSSESILERFNIVVNSMVTVGTSLWVSRSNGDICVIDTRLSTAGQVDNGKVVAVFENKLFKSRVSSKEEVKLTRAGKYVIGTYPVAGSDLNDLSVEIALWDTLDVDVIERIHSHWNRIIDIEKRIAGDTKNVT